MRSTNRSGSNEMSRKLLWVSRGTVSTWRSVEQQAPSLPPTHLASAPSSGLRCLTLSQLHYHYSVIDCKNRDVAANNERCRHRDGNHATDRNIFAAWHAVPTRNKAHMYRWIIKMLAPWVPNLWRPVSGLTFKIRCVSVLRAFPGCATIRPVKGRLQFMFGWLTPLSACTL